MKSTYSATSRTPQLPAFPCRPFTASSYQAFASLPDVLRSTATDGGAKLLDLRLTGKLSQNRWADTYSYGTVMLLSGELLDVCTTFSRKGELLLEGPVGCVLSLGTKADIARAVRDGHQLEQSRLLGHSGGRS